MAGFYGEIQINEKGRLVYFLYGGYPIHEDDERDPYDALTSDVDGFETIARPYRQILSDIPDFEFVSTMKVYEKLSVYYPDGPQPQGVASYKIGVHAEIKKYCSQDDRDVLVRFNACYAVEDIQTFAAMLAYLASHGYRLEVPEQDKGA